MNTSIISLCCDCVGFINGYPMFDSISKAIFLGFGELILEKKKRGEGKRENELVKAKVSIIFECSHCFRAQPTLIVVF